MAEKEVVRGQFKAVKDSRMPTFPYKPDDIASMVDMWEFPGREFALMARFFAGTGAQVSGYSFPEWQGIPTASLNQPALARANVEPDGHGEELRRI